MWWNTHKTCLIFLTTTTDSYFPPSTKCPVPFVLRPPQTIVGEDQALNKVSYVCCMRDPVQDVQLLNLCLLLWVQFRTPNMYLWGVGSNPLNPSLGLLVNSKQIYKINPWIVNGFNFSNRGIGL